MSLPSVLAFAEQTCHKKMVSREEPGALVAANYSELILAFWHGPFSWHLIHLQQSKSVALKSQQSNLY